MLTFLRLNVNSDKAFKVIAAGFFYLFLTNYSIAQRLNGDSLRRAFSKHDSTLCIYLGKRLDKVIKKLTLDTTDFYAGGDPPGYISTISVLQKDSVYFEIAFERAMGPFVVYKEFKSRKVTGIAWMDQNGNNGQCGIEMRIFNPYYRKKYRSKRK